MFLALTLSNSLSRDRSQGSAKPHLNVMKISVVRNCTSQDTFASNIAWYDQKKTENNFIANKYIISKQRKTCKYRNRLRTKSDKKKIITRELIYCFTFI